MCWNSYFTYWDVKKVANFKVFCELKLFLLYKRRSVVKNSRGRPFIKNQQNREQVARNCNNRRCSRQHLVRTILVFQLQKVSAFVHFSHLKQRAHHIITDIYNIKLSIILISRCMDAITTLFFFYPFFDSLIISVPDFLFWYVQNPNLQLACTSFSTINSIDCFLCSGIWATDVYLLYQKTPFNR